MEYSTEIAILRWLRADPPTLLLALQMAASFLGVKVLAAGLALATSEVVGSPHESICRRTGQRFQFRAACGTLPSWCSTGEAFRGFPGDLFRPSLEKLPLRLEEDTISDEQAQRRLQWGLSLCMASGIGGLGQLGRGREVARSLEFQPVPCLPRNVMAVSCGANHTVAWTSYGCCYSWGQAGVAPKPSDSSPQALASQHSGPQPKVGRTGSPSTSRNLIGRPPAPWETNSKPDTFGFFPGRVLPVAGGRHLPVTDAAAGQALHPPNHSKRIVGRKDEPIDSSCASEAWYSRHGRCSKIWQTICAGPGHCRSLLWWETWDGRWPGIPRLYKSRVKASEAWQERQYPGTSQGEGFQRPEILQ